MWQYRIVGRQGVYKVGPIWFYRWQAESEAEYQRFVQSRLANNAVDRTVKIEWIHNGGLSRPEQQ